MGEYYGIEMKGPLTVEKLPFEPTHDPADRGRLIYDLGEDSLKVATDLSYRDVLDTDEVGGVPLSDLARLDISNTFTEQQIFSHTPTGNGPGDGPIWIKLSGSLPVDDTALGLSVDGVEHARLTVDGKWLAKDAEFLDVEANSLSTPLLTAAADLEISPSGNVGVNQSSPSELLSLLNGHLLIEDDTGAKAEIELKNDTHNFHISQGGGFRVFEEGSVGIEGHLFGISSIGRVFTNRELSVGSSATSGIHPLQIYSTGGSTGIDLMDLSGSSPLRIERGGSTEVLRFQGVSGFSPVELDLSSPHLSVVLDEFGRLGMGGVVSPQEVIHIDGNVRLDQLRIFDGNTEEWYAGNDVSSNPGAFVISKVGTDPTKELVITPSEISFGAPTRISSGDVTLDAGAVIRPYNSEDTDPYTMSASEWVLEITSSPFTVVIPDAGEQGKSVLVVNSSSGSITLDATVINGQQTVTLPSNTAAYLVSNGASSWLSFEMPMTI